MMKKSLRLLKMRKCTLEGYSGCPFDSEKPINNNVWGNIAYGMAAEQNGYSDNSSGNKHI